MVEIAHGFFGSRRPLALRQRAADDGSGRKGASYKNVSKLIGTLISKRLATLHELKTVYDLEDAYNLLEVLLVDESNVNNHR